ncbi:hypothetical protein [Acetobacter sp. UBA5411]|uniref:ATP-dependent DNA ligase n=1 Tax=Acetobacter sp. UBA5411 TaxID=1945905 RepID=UPI0025C614D7|nr:hypothetical protein [Acetobacter sp. UBA5411]
MSLPEGFKPMKGDVGEWSDFTFPCYASPKIDGYRCIASGGQALSAKLEPHGNQFIQKFFKDYEVDLDGLDGELVVGAANDPEIFNKSGGAIRRASGEPDFTFWVFDYVNEEPFRNRIEWSRNMVDVAEFDGWRVRHVEMVFIRDLEALKRYYAETVARGFEGVMVRSLNGPYKFGRSTRKEGYLLKLKPYRDDEAILLEVIEEQANTNKAEKDATGRTKRSSAKAGKVGKGTAGKLRVRFINGPFKDQEHIIGTGKLTKDQKQTLWDERFGLHDDARQGNYQLMTVHHMDHLGGYTRPRHAGFLRWRDWSDIDLPEAA